MAPPKPSKDFNSVLAQKGFKLVHLNVRSLAKKIEQLRVIFKQPEIEVISISETWLTNIHAEGTYDLANYTTFRQDRSQHETGKKRGGGLVTYIKSELADSTIELKKLSTCTTFIEAQWLKIVNKHSSNVVLCTMYRPPEGELEKAIVYMNNCLRALNTAKNDIYILGDWNVNYKNMLSPNYKKMFFFENSNNLKQVIKDTTRNTDKTKSLIDLIFTNAPHISESGTIESFISDHQPVYIIKKQAKVAKTGVKFEGRSYKHLDLDSLLTQLSNANWHDLYANTDPNAAWDLLINKITLELDKVCPIRTTTIRNYYPEWIDPSLVNLLKDRDYFYKKAKETNNSDDWNIAKHLRNIANANIRRAKANFVVRQLDNNKGDGSKFWREIRKIYPTKKAKSKKSQIQLISDVSKLDVPVSETADFINDYFINVGNPPTQSHTLRRCKKSKSRSKPSAKKDRVPGQQHPIDDTQPPWSLTKFTEEEVLKVIKDIEINKSSGIEHLNNRVLKSILKVLTSQLTFIFNSSIESHSYPNSWKNAVVIPIPKKGDLTSVSNFRPISLLPQPGKLLEKLVHNRLNTYIESCNLLSTNQHGFRKNRSTLDAVFQLTNQINCNMDKKIPTLVSFLDFKKAFDCVQHSILINKLKSLNIDTNTLLWLQDYLTERSQKVLANNKLSGSLKIKQGVPQGSIMGPLLYIIYANDITRVIKKCHVALYADDTVLYSSCKKLRTARQQMQADLNALQRWCIQNGIYANATKTKFMVFGSKMTLANVEKEGIKLTINSQQIDRVHSYSYLGILLDEQLNYELHALSTINKVKAKVSQLRLMRRFLNQQAALLVYKNMILPILEYGNVFFSALSILTRKKMQTVQNKALRIALNCRDSKKELHATAKLQELKCRRRSHLLQFIFKRKNDKRLLVRRAAGRVTRSSKKILFTLKKPKTEKFKACLSYYGFRLWNQLPASVQKIENAQCFKHKVTSLYEVANALEVTDNN